VTRAGAGRGRLLLLVRVRKRVGGRDRRRRGTSTAASAFRLSSRWVRVRGGEIERDPGHGLAIHRET